jgi:hypothetical protein
MPRSLPGATRRLRDAFKGVRRIQDQSIDAVYDVIRRVNREVTRLAADLLEGARPKRPSQRGRQR